MVEKLDRRRFVRLVVVGAASVPALAALGDSAAAAPGTAAAVGEIVSVDSRGFMLRTRNDRIAVVTASDAEMYSGPFGAVSDSSRFVIGDRVAVQGTRDGDVLRATFVGSAFSVFSAKVESVSDDKSLAYTNLGVIRLEEGRLPFTPASAQDRLRKGDPIASGDVISGLGWRHPSTGETYLLIRGT